MPHFLAVHCTFHGRLEVQATPAPPPGMAGRPQCHVSQELRLRLTFFAARDVFVPRHNFILIIDTTSGPDTTSILLSTQLRSPPAEATQLRSPPAAATQLRGPSQNQSEVPALFSHLSYAPLPLSLPPPLLRRSISCSRPLSGGSSGSPQEWERFHR
jgi:hypothetical protein